MSYKNIVDAVVSINKSIPNVKESLDYEPTTPANGTVFVVFSEIPENDHVSNLEITTYDIKMRLLLSYTDAETCERKVITYIDDFKTRYQNAVKLDGALVNGSARISSVRGSYILVGAVTFRQIEFNLHVIERVTVTFSE